MCDYNMKVSREAISDECLLWIFSYLPLKDKLSLRLTSPKSQKLVDSLILSYLVISRERTFFQPSQEQYVTSLQLSENQQKPKLPPDAATFSEIFSNLSALHVGPGVSPMTLGFLKGILVNCAQSLRHLSWDISVMTERGPPTNKIMRASESIFQELAFEELETLALRLCHSPLCPLDWETYCQILQMPFPKLRKLTAVIYSSPDEQQGEMGRDEGNSSSIRRADSSGLAVWNIYYATFRFIASHSGGLKVIYLDYFHLNISTCEDKWLAALQSQNSALILANYPKSLKTLKLHFPEREGVFPWTLGMSLLSSQRSLLRLVFRSEGSAAGSAVSQVLGQNLNSLRRLNLFIGGFTLPFNSDWIQGAESLKYLDLAGFSLLLNSGRLPSTLRKLSLRLNYSSEDVLSLLRRSPHLRKLSLQHDGDFWTFWRPVSASMVQSVVESSGSLRKLCLYCWEEDVREYCEKEVKLKFSMRSKNKALVKIKNVS